MEVKEYYLGHPVEDQGNCVKQGFREILKQVEFQDHSVQFSSVTQSYLTLCNPMDHSLPGSSIHGIVQARVLEWGAIAFSVSHY